MSGLESIVSDAYIEDGDSIADSYQEEESKPSSRKAKSSSTASGRKAPASSSSSKRGRAVPAKGSPPLNVPDMFGRSRRGAAASAVSSGRDDDAVDLTEDW